MNRKTSGDQARRVRCWLMEPAAHGARDSRCGIGPGKLTSDRLLEIRNSVFADPRKPTLLRRPALISPHPTHMNRRTFLHFALFLSVSAGSIRAEVVAGGVERNGMR